MDLELGCRELCYLHYWNLSQTLSAAEKWLFTFHLQLHQVIPSLTAQLINEYQQNPAAFDS